VMLVDLGRNDVGRVAAFGSIELTEVMVVGSSPRSSLTSTAMLIAVSSSVVSLSSAASGVSLTGSIVIDTVALLVWASRSVIVYVKLSAPFVSGSGV